MLLETEATGEARSRAARSAAPHTGAIASLTISTDGLRLFTCAPPEGGVRVWESHTLALLQVIQPSLPVDALRLIRRPLALGAADGALPAAEGSASLLAPLRKFAEAEADGSEATQKAMGCVPCELVGGSALLELAHDGGVVAGAWDAVGQMPMMVQGPLRHAMTSALSLETHAPVADASSGAEAEATIRMLREQIGQLQQVNQELYQMAVDKSLGLST